MLNWLHWWDNRRIHWAKAFKSDLVSPSCNLAEAVNSSFAHKGSCNISLVRAAYEDTADSILLEKQWEQYREGARTCGSGPSSSKRTAREMAKQKREATRLVEELDILDTGKYLEQDAIAKAFQEYQIDPTCSFEPKLKSHSKKRKRGRPKKRHVSVYDVTESESSDQEERNDDQDKRPGRLRKKPSKNFQKSLQKAITQKNKLKVVKLVENGNCYEVVIKSRSTVSRENGKRDQWNTYSCTISQTPACDCPYYVGSAGKICKHIIWTLINLFQIPQGNSLLYQVALTKREFTMLKTKALTNIPDEIRYYAASEVTSPRDYKMGNISPFTTFKFINISCAPVSH